MLFIGGVRGKKPGPGQGYDYAWSGIIGNVSYALAYSFSAASHSIDSRSHLQSADGVPYIGAVPDKPGQWICAGHNGHGMVRTFSFSFDPSGRLTHPNLHLDLCGLDW